MKQIRFMFLFAAIFGLVVGCGGGNGVPTGDLGPVDTMQPDATPDSIVPEDVPVGEDTIHDTKVPDVPPLDIPGDTPTDVPADTPPDVLDDLHPGDLPIEDNGDAVVPDEGQGDSIGPVACSSNGDCDETEFCKVNACGEPGLCEPTPALCMVPLVPKNLCACDGLYYDSICFANMARTNVATGANCGTETTCSDDAGCLGTEYCKKTACGDTEGKCATKAELCPIFPDPVCGCDGVTYDNACTASAYGANIDSTGAACATVTTCTSDTDCTVGFCFKNSCEPTAEGTCETKPPFCLVIGDGVCGCDGNTYTNECLAKKAGVSIDPTGDECNATETCSSNADCTSTQYCKKTTCTAAEGVCTAVSIKPCSDVEDAVCGCDGVVYPNACKAAKCRTNTQKIAACTSTDTCSRKDFCLRGEYCLSAVCGNGVCMPIPKSCETATYPVCGCDDVTYKNFCEAAKAGVSIQGEGRCGIL